MRGYRKFLALYSLILTTALFLASIFFIPRPENFLFLLLFLPTALFFWLNGPKKITKTSPDSVPDENQNNPSLTPSRLTSWAAISILTLFISTLTLYIYLTWGKNYTSGKIPQSSLNNSSSLEEIKGLLLSLQSQGASQEALLKDIKIIKEEVDQLRKTSDLKSQVLGVNLPGLLPSTSPETPTPAKETSFPNFLTITTPRWQTLDVFKQKQSNSQVIVQMEYGKNYPIIQKESGWYKITLPDSREGWVINQYVKEVSLNKP